MNGKFISIDGSEGCGKTSQISNIRHYLATAGKAIYTTREPGGTPVGERIRELILDPTFQPAYETELLLIFAARKEHLDKEILPRLSQNQWIISDRFNDSSYAYQGFGRNISLERIRALEYWLQGSFQPDLSLILTLDSELAEQRIIARGQEKDRFERENKAFFTRIADGYAYRARSCEHVHLIDANGTPETVFSRIQPHLDRLIQK